MSDLIMPGTIARWMDKLVLFSMNWMTPDSLAESHDAAPPFDQVLAETAVNFDKTDIYQLTAPGEHPVWLDTPQGELISHVRVQLAVDPGSPLLLYHHGFSEIPYTHSWERIFRSAAPFPTHAVCVQAPFHNHWRDPFFKGFASIENIFQTFAGSLRLMALIQSRFEEMDAPYSVAAGVSWGGITSLLYEGIFQRTRAVIPMLSSPDLAQVLLDIADLFHRSIPIPRSRVSELLDFTPTYQRCAPHKVFPLLGQDDMFFRREKHAHHYQDRPLRTIPGGHIGAFLKADSLRQHIYTVLDTIAAPRPSDEIVRGGRSLVGT